MGGGHQERELGDTTYAFKPLNLMLRMQGWSTDLEVGGQIQLTLPQVGLLVIIYNRSKVIRKLLN